MNCFSQSTIDHPVDYIPYGAEQQLAEFISDDYIRKTLAEISGVRQRAQKLDDVFFHPFPARMPLNVTQFLIERLTTPGAIVLDPMVGSGTTLIAAKKQGRVGIGFDLDPLAVLLSRIATRTANIELLQMVHARVLTRAFEQLQQSRYFLTQIVAGLGKEEKDFLDYWFPERSQHELFALASAIQIEQDQVIQEFLWGVFSSLIIAHTAGASYALDLTHSRPHRVFSKKVVWPLEAWTYRFQRAISKLIFRAGEDECGKAEVRLGDARNIELQDSTVDLVFTSPPYLQAIDYIRTHKFSLIWMGHDLGYLRQLRSTMVGTHRGLDRADNLPTSIEDSLTRLVQESSRQRKIRRYLSDIYGVLVEIHRVLKPGALAVLAFGPSIVSKNRHDVINVLNELIEPIGLTIVGTVARRLNYRRRVLPPPRRVPGKNSLNKRMQTEVFVAFRKPQ